MPADPRPPRRADPRYAAALRVDVTCREWSQVERLVTLNASRGGLFLRGKNAAPVGAALTLEVHLPDGNRLSLHGTVVHVTMSEEAAATGRPAGFGVKLDAAHASDLLLLEAMARAAAPRPEDDPGVAPVARPGAPIPARTDRPPVVIGRMAAPGIAAGAERPLPSPTSETVFGIDYGTTYSSIAVVRAGKAFLVSDEAGRALVPSIVSYPQGGGVLVGWDARDRVATDPGHTVHSAKRLLGRPITEMEVQNQLAQQPYAASRGPNDQVILSIGRTPLSIPQIAAEVLRLLKRTAERSVGVAVEEVVLTVPVTWGLAQRQALRKAAELAGLRPVALVEEPAAAGLAYGFGAERNEIVAVYDFSGGTFDFTLIDVSRESFRLLVSAGDPWLGGDDFDLVLAKDVANQFWKEHRIELQKRLVEWQRLIWACEAAKRDLTGAERAWIEVPGIARAATGPIDLRAEITRADFERLCADLVTRSLDIVAQALRDVDLEPSDVGQVVLTGGCTRIPMVRAAVSRFFDREVGTHVNPDEAVALGAAVQGALVAREARR